MAEESSSAAQGYPTRRSWENWAGCQCWRRMLLRLTYWGKVLRMETQRLVRRVYEVGRARLEANPNDNTWCNLTRKWLRQLGLETVWKTQTVDDQWRETLKERIMRVEEQRWRLGTSKNARLENYAKWKTCLTTCAEQYLAERSGSRRRLWTKLRAGSLELRIETGRWEWVVAAGVQKMVPRWARLCPLCFGEVEDAEHSLFRCPAYTKLRTQFLLGAGLVGELGRAAREVAGGQRGRENEVWMWMMSEAGTQRGMLFLEQVMKERSAVLG